MALPAAHFPIGLELAVCRFRPAGAIWTSEGSSRGTHTKPVEVPLQGRSSSAFEDLLGSWGSEEIMHRNNISLTVVRDRSFDNLLAGDDVVPGTMLSPRQLNSAGNCQQHQLHVERAAVAGDAAVAAAGWRAQTPENEPQVGLLPQGTSWGGLVLHVGAQGFERSWTACTDNRAVAWCRTMRICSQLCSSRLNMAVAMRRALGPAPLLQDAGAMQSLAVAVWAHETTSASAVP